MIPFPRNGLAIHRLGRLQAGEVEQGGAEVDEADEAVDAGAELAIEEVFAIFGDADGERDVEAALVDVAFAAGEHAAVVAEVEDEGVLQEAVLLQPGDDLADLVVDIA